MMDSPFAALSLFGITLISFWWVLSVKDNTFKVLCVLLAVFFFIYCGIGVGYMKTPNKYYMATYTVYVITFSIFLKLFMKRRIKIPESYVINSFSEKWSKLIILVYLLFFIIPLIQSGKIGNLINPPLPKLGDVIVETNFEENQVSSIFGTLINFTYIFYLLALSKYVKKPFILVALLILPTYIGYCRGGYIARSGAAYLITIVVFVLYHYYPRIRKAIIYCILLGVPIVIVVFAAFVNYRLGADVEKRGVIESLNYLIQFESYFPQWYDGLQNGHSTYIPNYFYWLVTLPLPGFMKLFDININFNALFTSDVTGVQLSGVTSIVLPGLVNEGVYIFGEVFFFIHAIIFAFIFSITYNTISSRENNYIALVSVMLQFSLLTARGGTFSYAIAVKMLLVLFLFKLFFTTRRKVSS